MSRLTGRTALITGGSSGIGLATAKLFQAEGAQLVITGVDPDSLARAQKGLGSDALVVHTSIHNQKASPHYCVYAASKAALRSMVRSLSQGLIGRGSRVNAVSPGAIDTPRFAGLPEDRPRGIADKCRIKRFGTGGKVAKLALFLASDDSSYLVGEQNVVDSGYSLL